MGIGPFGHCSSWRENNSPCVVNNVTNVTVKWPNPDPNNWEVLGSWQIGPYLVVKFKYPNCTNFEGTKIMVFEGCTLETLKKQTTVDPHFANNSRVYSPIARFVPTDRGLEMALAFCRMMQNNVKELAKEIAKELRVNERPGHHVTGWQP